MFFKVTAAQICIRDMYYGIELLCGCKQMRFLPRKNKVVNEENRKTVTLLKSWRKLCSFSSELIQLIVPRICISATRRCQRLPRRASISTFQTGDFDRKVSLSKHCDFAFKLVCVKYQQNNLHLETK